MEKRHSCPPLVTHHLVFSYGGNVSKIVSASLVCVCSLEYLRENRWLTISVRGAAPISDRSRLRVASAPPDGTPRVAPPQARGFDRVPSRSDLLRRERDDAALPRDVRGVPRRGGARAIVDALCLEQTVELPLALVPPGTWINEHVVAKCESLCRRAIQPKHPEAGDVRWEAVVRYSDDTAGGELPQLLNVIFGNTSIKENVMVLDVALSPTLTNKFLGPRFGTAGLREILGVPKGPMLMTALKPMGSSVTKLAEMAYLFAKGGIDVIKDDHGLANQRYAPYEERVRACCAAVKEPTPKPGARACTPRA